MRRFEDHRKYSFVFLWKWQYLHLYPKSSHIMHKWNNLSQISSEIQFKLSRSLNKILNVLILWLSCFPACFLTKPLWSFNALVENWKPTLLFYKGKEKVWNKIGCFKVKLSWTGGSLFIFPAFRLRSKKCLICIWGGVLKVSFDDN